MRQLDRGRMSSPLHHAPSNARQIAKQRIAAEDIADEHLRRLAQQDRRKPWAIERLE
jgi:uncharacterized membrane protein